MSASAVLGPIVAGFLISADLAGLTWRPIFLINIVLGSTGFIAALRLLPHDRPAGAVPIDGLGSGLLGASMFALIYGLIEGSTAGWTALPILCLAAGAALLAGFGVRQRLAANPLILPSLLANRGFTAGLLLGLAFFAAVNGLAYVISLFFQTALGLTPDRAALALSPLMAGIIVASVVCRPLIASGALSAVQQLAAAIGSAVVTTVYFSQRAQHGAGPAMTVSVAVVAAIAVGCLGLVWLLPKSAAPDPH